MNKTKIEWVKNPDGTQGYTWNPITGCLNGCPYCYARKLANGRLKQRYLANKRIAPFTSAFNYALNCLNRGKHSGTSRYWMCQRCSEGLEQGCADFIIKDPFYPRFWHRRIAGGSPKGIFACDMGELFGDWIPPWWQEVIFAQIRLYKQHRFYLLTKQPQNLIKFSPFPDNCWVGVTITEPFPDNTPLVYLAQVEASIKFISFEPLLKWRTGITNQLVMSLEKAGINWLIIGAQTKPYKPPRIEWVQEIVEAADKAGIPVFLKDNLESLLPHTKPFYREVSFGGRFLIYRREMP